MCWGRKRGRREGGTGDEKEVGRGVKHGQCVKERWGGRP